MDDGERLRRLVKILRLEWRYPGEMPGPEITVRHGPEGPDGTVSIHYGLGDHLSAYSLAGAIEMAERSVLISARKRVDKDRANLSMSEEIARAIERELAS